MRDWAKEFRLQGKEAGKESVLRIAVLDELEEGKTQEEIIASLCKYHHISRRKAMNLIEKCMVEENE